MSDNAHVDYRAWAFLSALFAAMTAVLSKKGVQDVPSNLALAIRVVFVLAVTVGIAVYTKQTRIDMITTRSWTFLALSAVATGLSWLCYFRALQLGPVSRVAPIDKLSFVAALLLSAVFLGEKITLKLAIGAVLIVVGVLITL